jgi:hypothetical protein
MSLPITTRNNVAAAASVNSAPARDTRLAQAGVPSPNVGGVSVRGEPSKIKTLSGRSASTGHVLQGELMFGRTDGGKPMFWLQGQGKNYALRGADGKPVTNALDAEARAIKLINGGGATQLRKAPGSNQSPAEKQAHADLRREGKQQQQEQRSTLASQLLKKTEFKQGHDDPLAGMADGPRHNVNQAIAFGNKLARSGIVGVAQFGEGTKFATDIVKGLNGAIKGAPKFLSDAGDVLSGRAKASKRDLAAGIVSGAGKLGYGMGGGLVDLGARIVAPGEWRDKVAEGLGKGQSSLDTSYRDNVKKVGVNPDSKGYNVASTTTQIAGVVLTTGRALRSGLVPKSSAGGAQPGGQALPPARTGSGAAATPKPVKMTRTQPQPGNPVTNSAIRASNSPVRVVKTADGSVRLGKANGQPVTLPEVVQAVANGRITPKQLARAKFDDASIKGIVGDARALKGNTAPKPASASARAYDDVLKTLRNNPDVQKAMDHTRSPAEMAKTNRALKDMEAKDVFRGAHVEPEGGGKAGSSHNGPQPQAAKQPGANKPKVEFAEPNVNKPLQGLSPGRAASTTPVRATQEAMDVRTAFDESGRLKDPYKFVDTITAKLNPADCRYGNCGDISARVVDMLNSRGEVADLRPVDGNNPSGSSTLEIEGAGATLKELNNGRSLVEGGPTDASGKLDAKLQTMKQLMKDGQSFELAIYDPAPSSLYGGVADHQIAITLNANGNVIGLDAQRGYVLEQAELKELLGKVAAFEVHPTH